jgi:hypothetical protein
MFPTITIPKLHFEYQLWMNELSFFKEEIKIFEKHLEEVANKNTKVEVRAKVEHFQNQFIRQKEVIDELKHKLNISERQLADYIKDVSGMGLENIRMDNHPWLRGDMQTFRKIYTDLKNSFRRFESEWM